MNLPNPEFIQANFTKIHNLAIIIKILVLRIISLSTQVLTPTALIPWVLITLKLLQVTKVRIKISKISSFRSGRRSGIQQQDVTSDSLSLELVVQILIYNQRN